MKRIIIVHKWGGSSQDDWRPWLKIELEKKGYKVLVPDMPDTNIPVIENWVNKIREVVNTPDSETYFIGHSIGCQAILKYLETINTQVGGALFVAGWFNLKNLENEEVVKIANPWIENPIEIEKIKKVLTKSILLISKDDPYGAYNENIEGFNKIKTKICVFDNAGHFIHEKEPIILEQLENLTNY